MDNNCSVKPLTEAPNALCPFISERLEDCYYTQLGSQTIKAALYFCGRNYTHFEQYRRISDGGRV